MEQRIQHTLLRPMHLFIYFLFILFYGDFIIYNKKLHKFPTVFLIEKIKVLLKQLMYSTYY